MNSKVYQPVEILPSETALKIAAGEVIERPSSVVRELLDNSIDAGATQILLEIENGGIDKIRAIDNGCGMTKEDLSLCTLTHSTSKIREADDLLHLSSLGFRGEALSSIQAVSDLEIRTKREGFSAWKLKYGEILPTTCQRGAIVEASHLFENFPARKKFLKRPQYEGTQCRQIFIEKSLPFYNIHTTLVMNGKTSLVFDRCASLRERCLQVFASAFGFKESDDLFFETAYEGENFSFNAVLGTPDVYRSNKKYINIFVNGRRINEYGLVQSVCYGSEGYFPNGGYPVVFLFLQVDPSRIDFNIHPAKKEAHFEDYNEIHHAIHTRLGNFYKQKTIMAIYSKKKEDEEDSSLSLKYMDSSFEAEHEENKSKNIWQALNEGSIHSVSTQNEQNSTFLESSPHSAQHSYFDVADISHVFPIKRETFASQTAEARAEYGGGISKKTHNFRVLGQFCGTFIAVEKGNALYIIDQHAAHERIIYEALKKTVGSSQELLAPYIFETDSEKNDEIIRKNISALKGAGFKIEEIENGRWEISAVPLFYKGTQQHLFSDIVQAKDAGSLINHLLATASCRAACKDGDVLDYGAMCDIVERVFLLKEPLCPHGRPIYFMLDRMELFRKVKRIT